MKSILLPCLPATAEKRVLATYDKINLEFRQAKDIPTCRKVRAPVFDRLPSCVASRLAAAATYRDSARTFLQDGIFFKKTSFPDQT